MRSEADLATCYERPDATVRAMEVGPVRRRCDVCGTERAVVPALEHLVRCLECGFVYYPTDKEIDFRAMYGPEYFAGFEYVDYLGQEGALRRSMRRHLRQMARYRPLGGAMLEVGCAYGFFLDEARRVFDKVAGIDVAEAPVEYARDTLCLDARTGDFPSMSLDAGSFDVICFWDTIEHVARPDRFVAKAYDVLRDAGHLFLTTGDIGSRVARWQGKSWRQIHPPTHLSYFSRRTISMLLARSGYEVVGIETAPYFHTLFNVLATVRLRGGTPGQIAERLLHVLPTPVVQRLGGWVDLRDIMFVAARKRAPAD